MIRLVDIHKDYGSVKANDGVNLTVRPGSVHALLGENGAGKSTLMKILSGFIPRSSGRVLVRGSDADISSPVKALRSGIGMLYQEPMDFPQLTVLDNLMAGRPSGVFVRRKQAINDLMRLSSELGFCFDPSSLLTSLTLGERQQLEMVRLLSLGVQILILDEPTTGITDLQKDILFTSLRRLADQGKSVILVSHKMDDVTALCDEATVMRSGKVTGHFTRPFSKEDLLRCMFPHSLDPEFTSEVPRSAPFFYLDRVSAHTPRMFLKPLSLHFRPGEIVGLAGLEGSGQELLLRCAAGFSKLHGGSVRVDDRVISGRSLSDFRKSGIFFVPGSRMEEGLVSGLTLAEHVALNRSGYALVPDARDVDEQTSRSIQTFFIKGARDSTVDSLSGGNQQKFLLSLLPDNPRMLFLENPTRGLDHDSSDAVWSILMERSRVTGTAIVFSSPELDEIYQVAHRVLVFSNGTLMLDGLCHEVDRNDVAMAIAGSLKTPVS